MPFSFVVGFNEGVAELLEDEAKAMKDAQNG